MCFSAEASFTMGAALVPAGLYCVQSAFRKNIALLPLALVPIAFGLQQLGEGFVWAGLGSEDAALVRKASVFFLFFAIPFWPFWIPFSLLFLERRPEPRYVLGGFVLLSLVWVCLIVPLLIQPEAWLTTRQVHHSIRYEFDGLPGFQVLPPIGWRLLYLAGLCGAVLVGRRGRTEWFHLVGGVAVVVVFLVAYGLFWYAFTSVWCFFAAVLSLYLCYVFHRFPAHKPAPSPERAAPGAPFGLAK